MTKWWHVSWKRVCLALLVVFSALYGIAFSVNSVAHQLMPWYFTRTTSRDYPRLALTPTALTDKSLATLSGVRVACFGFSFQTPWKQILNEKNGKSFSNFAFKDGGRILVLDGSDELNFAKVSVDDPRIAKLVGQEALKSNYALAAAAMAVTPDQVKWWKSRSQNARNFFLLSEKMIHMRDLGTLYLLNFGELRGFQQGNPSVQPYRVQLDLFDNADHHYQISISGKDEHSSVLSQGEINAMVASLTPISAN